jgi:16S rRNA (guanine527-N7)-methyltransferase
MPQAAPDLATDRAQTLAHLDVSRETIARLDAFVDLLQTWQAKTNLIANSTLNAIWSRHIADSLQLLKHARPDARVWLDLGTGGGFPGLVIAAALDGGRQVHLVESNLKKAAFLREASRVLQVPALVHAARIEDFVNRVPLAPDIVTARALAPLPKLLEYIAPFVEKGAQGLLLKGQDIEAELTEASKYWTIDADLVPSVTDTSGRVLVVRGLTRGKNHNPRARIS